MDKLIEKLGTIAYDGINPCRDCGTTNDIIPTGKELVEEVKNIAIEFVKYIQILDKCDKLLEKIGETVVNKTPDQYFEDFIKVYYK